MKKRSKNRLAGFRPLRVEPLESRMVLDGNVRAFVSGGTLFLQGDGQANEILIEQTALRQFIVSSRDGATTINGQTGDQTFTRVRNNLDISLNNGNDVVEIVGSSDDAVTVSGRLRIRTGGGADQVLLSEVNAIGLHVDTGGGADLVNVGDDGSSGGLEIAKEAVIVTGSGRDDARIFDSLFKRFLVLDMGGSNDTTSISDTTFRKQSTIIGGSNFDTVNRENNSGRFRLVSFEQRNNTVDTPADVAPVAANDTATVNRGATTTINVATNDTAPGSTLNLASITITQAPTGGTATANSNGTVTYTSNSASTGATDSFQYTIRNANGTVSNTATVSITVNATTLAAVGDAASVIEDASPNTVTGNVLTNDTGGTGTKTVTAVNGATGSVGTNVQRSFGTFNIGSTGAFTYTLDNSNATVNALNNGQTLMDTITYTVTAGSETSTATLTITIQGTTELAAVADAASITEDATPNTVTGNVVTNDTGGTGTKTVTAVNDSTSSVGTNVQRTFGTFNIASNGSFTYALDNSNTTVNALNNGQTLMDTITYTVTSGGATSTATLTVTIAGTTDLAAVNDSVNIVEDAAPNNVTGNVLTNDTGGTGTKTVTAVNGSTSSVATNVQRTFGTFNIAADGGFTYTLDNSNATVNALNAGQTLTDTITYAVTAGGATSTATLTVMIQGTAELAAVNDDASVTEDATPNTSTGNVLTNDTGGAGTKTVTAVNGNTGSVGTSVQRTFGAFNIAANGAFTYTLDNSNTTVNALNSGQTLMDTISYTVTAGGVTATATLTVTIEGATDVPLDAEDDVGEVTEDASTNSFTGNALSNDQGGAGNKTITQVNGVAGNVGQSIAGANGLGQFNVAANGAFTYTIDNNNATVQALGDGQTAMDTIEYTVSDGTTTQTATITITIEGHTELVAQNDDDDIAEDASPDNVTGNVLDNDQGGVAARTVTQVNGSAASVGTNVDGDFGTFNIASNGAYTYTLDNTDPEVNNLGTGQTLEDTIQYTVGDGITTQTATLTITIQGNTDV